MGFWGSVAKAASSAYKAATSSSGGGRSGSGGGSSGNRSSSKTISDYQRDYANARARGDSAGMQAANQGANAIRSATGQSNVYAGQDISNTRNTSSANKDYSAILYDPNASYQDKLDAYSGRLSKQASMEAAGTWNKDWAPTSSFQSLLVNQANPYAQGAGEYEEKMLDTEDQARQMYQSYVQQGTDRLNAQRGDIGRSYDDASRQAYISYMQGQKAIPQRLAAAGITGGAAESTMLGAQSAYQGALSKVDMGRQKALSDIDMAVTELRNSGDLQRAQYVLANREKIAENLNQSYKADISRFDDMMQQNREYDFQSKGYEDDKAYRDKLFAQDANSEAYRRALQTVQSTGDYSIMRQFGWNDEQIRAANSRLALSDNSGSGRSGGSSQSSGRSRGSSRRRKSSGGSHKSSKGGGSSRKSYAAPVSYSNETPKPKQDFGNNYDMKSVSDLGFGPISIATLESLIQQGKVGFQKVGGKIKVYKIAPTGGNQLKNSFSLGR